MSITKTGLHTSTEAKAIWKQRAGLTAGITKYKVNGDVSTNSPGDWTRILANANSFLANPGAVDERYSLPTFTGCIKRDATGNSDPKAHGVKLRDAAFVDYLSDTSVYTPTIKIELLRYANDPLYDFSDRSRFCTTNGGIADANPGFPLSEWLTRYLVAYDYIKGSFSSPERVILDRWFLNAATYFNIMVDLYLVKRYKDRIGGDYTLTSYSIVAQQDTLPKNTLYYGGPRGGFFVGGYNNRIGTIVQFIGITGIFLKNSELKTSAKRFFYEWLKFGVFPTGEVADMERWRDGYSETGLNYALSLSGVMSMMAFHFAFDGDTSLINYSTVDGYFGTESPGNPKSLLQVIQNIQNYLNGTHTRYATATDPTPLSAPEKLKIKIDGYEPSLTWHNRVISDTWFAVPNVLYNNATVKTNYLRTAGGTVPYPTESYLRKNGPNEPYGGNANIIPGVLLLFGQMEGVIDWLGTAPTPKIDQTITFPQIPTKTFGVSPFLLTATSGSGLAITYTVISGPATVATNTLTITGAGTVVVKASQTGNGTYNPASSVDQTFVVNKLSQTINFLNIVDKQIGVDTTFTLTATTSASLSVEFEIVSGPGSISGTTFTIGGVGVTTIKAYQAGTVNYLPISFERTFSTIAAAPPVVTNILSAKTGVPSTTVDEFDITNVTDESLTNPVSQNTHFIIDWDATLIGGAKTVNKITVTMSTPIPEFYVQHNPGGGFVDLIHITNNTLKVVEVPIPNVSVTNIRWDSINKTWKWNLLELKVLGY